jgi:hypothetical protein
VKRKFLGLVCDAAQDAVQNVWGPTWLKYRAEIRGKTALMIATVRQLVTVPSRYSRKKPVWYDVPVGNTVGTRIDVHPALYDCS